MRDTPYSDADHKTRIEQIVLLTKIAKHLRVSGNRASVYTWSDATDYVPVGSHDGDGDPVIYDLGITTESKVAFGIKMGSRRHSATLPMRLATLDGYEPRFPAWRKHEERTVLQSDDINESVLTLGRAIPYVGRNMPEGGE